MNENNKNTTEEWTPERRQIELMKIQRKIRKEEEEKRKAKRELFDMIFPELSGIPVFWLIVAGVCILFNLFTLII